METTLLGVMALVLVFVMWWTLRSTGTRLSDSDRDQLAGRPLTLEEYDDLEEVKLELYHGYLGDAEMRTKLLRALIVNEGLIRTVQLAPPHVWREALRRRDGPRYGRRRHG